MTHRVFIERLLIALAILFLAWLMWQMRGLLILVFGAILVAVVFRTIANPIAAKFKLHSGLALFIAVFFVLGIFALAFVLFGAEIISQASGLSAAVPKAWETLQSRLEPLGLSEPFRQWTSSMTGGSNSGGGGVVSSLGSFAQSLGSAIGDTVLVLVGGIYLAAQPNLYKRGFAKLAPESARGLMMQAFEDSWVALRLFLKGRLISMTIVGVLTGLGLWIIGVPGFLALAAVAFILEFVPFVGPLIAAIPAVLLAVAIDPVKALWVAGLYLAIQQIEGNVIEPIVQQRAVDLPPALLLFAIFASGLMFGIVGVLFAAPLAVVLFVMVKRLYVREALNTPTPIPGEKAA